MDDNKERAQYDNGSNMILEKYLSKM